MAPRFLIGALSLCALSLADLPAWAAPEQSGSPPSKAKAEAGKPASKDKPATKSKVTSSKGKPASKGKVIASKSKAKVAAKAAPAAKQVPTPPSPWQNWTAPSLTLSTTLAGKPLPAPVPSVVVVPPPVLASPFPPLSLVAPAPPSSTSPASPRPADPEAGRVVAETKPGGTLQPAPKLRGVARPAEMAAVPGAVGRSTYVASVKPLAPGGAGPNPYLTPQQVNDPVREWGQVINGVKQGFAPAGQGVATVVQRDAGLRASKLSLPSLPSLPSIPPLLPEDFSLLPKIKTVYPTGEKPLVIVTFKCPTELIGITPLPTKALHDIVTFGMDGINSTNLLSFNMQQVCQ